MKIFFDTNVIIAAFASHGTCSDLFEHCLSEYTICISQQVLDELYKVLANKLRFPKALVAKIVTFTRQNTTIISHEPLPETLCRDPDDDNILAAAISGNVDCLVSGGKDLLELKKVKGIRILKPSDFWKFEKEKKYLKR